LKKSARKKNFWHWAGIALAMAMGLAIAGQGLAQDRNHIKKTAADPQRPAYHFLPVKNWMNDPNGLIQFNGDYHLFYQYNPNGASWANMSWGHAKSKDLVHWERLPVALLPDQPYDRYGVFSGTAVNDSGTAAVIYTCISSPDFRKEGQCLAQSRDMVRWEKYSGNPVIAAPPRGLRTVGFRDPYVWNQDGRWNMVVGSGIRDRGGAILLYRSKDLRVWEYAGPVAVGDIRKNGRMWECPSFFQLGKKWVMIVSPMTGRTIYFVGDFKDDKFSPDFQEELDLGGSLYAPQVFKDDQGRSVMFGWLKENYWLASRRGWQGVQTLPRVLTLGADNRLNFEPAREVESLRGKKFRLEDIKAGPGSGGVIKEAKGDALEIFAEIEVREAAQAGIKVRASPDDSEQTLIYYDRAGERLVVDRSRSSRDPAAKTPMRSAPFKLAEGETLKLRIFLDRSVVEVFANSRVVMSSRIYPARADSLGLELFSTSGTMRVKSLDIWEMTPIW